MTSKELLPMRTLQTSAQNLYLQLLYKSIYLKMGFYHYSTERGQKSACTTSKLSQKQKEEQQGQELQKQ